MSRDSDPWAAAVGAWVLLVDLLPTVERELAIPPAEAARALRHSLESYEVIAEVLGLAWPDWERFEADKWIFRDQYGRADRVSEKGWRNVDWKAGTLAGYPIRVLWAHVVDALPRPKLPTAAARATNRRQRPAGLNYAESDQPLLAEMRRLISTDEAKTRWDAALAVVGEAKGQGQTQSKAKRLVKRFAAAFSSERDGED
jgi:hypothetical protein